MPTDGWPQTPPHDSLRTRSSWFRPSRWDRVKTYILDRARAPRVPVVRVMRGQHRSLQSSVAEDPLVTNLLVSPMIAARSNGHVRPWRHRGLSGWDAFARSAPGSAFGRPALSGNLGLFTVVGCRADVFPTTCPQSPSRRPTRPGTPAFERRHGHKELCGDPDGRH